jgi:hypothetical protein
VLRVADQHVVGMLQSKSGWDFVAQGAHSIRLARDECAAGEPARLVRMSAIKTALAERIPVRNAVPDAEADTSGPLR